MQAFRNAFTCVCLHPYMCVVFKGFRFSTKGKNLTNWNLIINHAVPHNYSHTFTITDISKIKPGKIPCLVQVMIMMMMAIITMKTTTISRRHTITAVINKKIKLTIKHVKKETLTWAGEIAIQGTITTSVVVSPYDGGHTWAVFISQENETSPCRVVKG